MRNKRSGPLYTVGLHVCIYRRCFSSTTTRSVGRRPFHPGWGLVDSNCGPLSRKTFSRDCLPSRCNKYMPMLGNFYFGEVPAKNLSETGFLRVGTCLWGPTAGHARVLRRISQLPKENLLAQEFQILGKRVPYLTNMFPLADGRNGTNWHVHIYSRKDESSIDMDILSFTSHVARQWNSRRRTYALYWSR